MRKNMLHHAFDIRDHICEANQFGQCKKGYKYFCECCGFGHQYYKCTNTSCYQYKLKLFQRDHSKISYLALKLDDYEFHYLFENYSEFKEIQDKTFHEKRLKYLNAQKDFEMYIRQQSEQELIDFKNENYATSDTFNDTSSTIQVQTEESDSEEDDSEESDSEESDSEEESPHHSRSQI